MGIPQIPAGSEQGIMLRQLLRVLLIIVEIVDIRDHMIASAGIDAGSGIVIQLGGLIYHPQQIFILLSPVAVPGFVKRAPPYNGRMVEISLQHLHPFRQKSFQRLWPAVVQPPAAMLLPDQVPKLVAEIQISGLKDFLMQSGPIEPCRQRETDVSLQILLRRSRVDPSGIKPLIQYQPLKDRPIVDQKSVALYAKLPHAEIAFDLVLPVGQLQIVQPALSRLPQMGLRQV